MAKQRRSDPGHPLMQEDLDGYRLLLIDLPDDLVGTVGGMERAERHPVRFGEITIDLIARYDPDMVLSPLVGPDFDAMDVGAMLLRCGYLGPLRALTTPLPNLQTVRSEVRGHCVGLDFDLIVLSPPAETGH